MSTEVISPFKTTKKATRNNGYLIKLPIIKTEYARKGFFYMAAKTYNDLPLNIREADEESFLKLVKEHYAWH